MNITWSICDKRNKTTEDNAEKKRKKVKQTHNHNVQSLGKKTVGIRKRVNNKIGGEVSCRAL